MVSRPVRLPDSIRFGDDFELDVRAYELRCAGLPLKLKPIPMELLLLLVERRGELVTREQIVERIWGKGVFLDTDNSINGAISRIRQLLRDDPERPRFVQTVTGKGYRFIAPAVAAGPSPVPETAVASQTPAAEVDTNPGALVIAIDRSSAQAVGGERRPSAARWKLFIPILALLIAGVIAGALYVHARLANKLTGQDTIVLADFANSTGDPIFDDTLKQALTLSLRQSPFLNILPESKVRKALKLMTREPTAVLTSAVASELCQRAGSKAFVAGAIGALGTEYVLGLKAVNCRNGDTLAQEQVTAPAKEKVLAVLGDAATKLRSELGESLATVQKFDVPLEEATTPSLEALQAFSQGWRAWKEKGEVEALPYFKRAVELDPKFAQAYVAMGTVYGNLEQPSLAIESMTKAYELRERVSERERFNILGHYYGNVTGELEKAKAAYQQWKRAYPSDLPPHMNSGNIDSSLGRYTDALAEYLEARRVEPNNVLIHENLALAYINLNRLDEAQATLEEAFAFDLEDANLHALLLNIALLRGDSATVQRQLSWAEGKPGVEDAFLAYEEEAEASVGHLARARELSRQAVESAIRSGSKEAAAVWQLHGALHQAEVGNFREASKAAEAALIMAPNRNTQILAAIVLAGAGKEDGARATAEKLDSAFPLDTVMQAYWLPSIRAAIQLNRGHAAQAIDALQPTIPYELGNSPPTSDLYPVCLRGQALLLSHQGAAAVVEFQKVLAHRPLTNFVLGALANLQLGRAYAMSGDTDKAKSAYQDFLTLWKNADPNIPVLKQAKAEYAGLSRPD